MDKLMKSNLNMEKVLIYIRKVCKLLKMAILFMKVFGSKIIFYGVKKQHLMKIRNVVYFKVKWLIKNLTD